MVNLVLAAALGRVEQGIYDIEEFIHFIRILRVTRHADADRDAATGSADQPVRRAVLYRFAQALGSKDRLIQPGLGEQLDLLLAPVA